MRLSALWASTRGWFLRYDHLQSLVTLFLYLQVLCSLVGSLGALYNGILLSNLALALFALVAIESGSEKLVRTYAALLALALLLDVAWFILFTKEIRENNGYGKHGKFLQLPLSFVLCTQSISFGLRFVSAIVWLMMYRLGLTTDNSASYEPVDFDRRIGNLFSQSSNLSTLPAYPYPDEVLGGSIYDPAYYYSLFAGPEGLFTSSKDPTEGIDVDGTTPTPHVLAPSF